MGRFINESVQQVMEEILSTKLKINHYSNFAPSCCGMASRRLNASV